MQTFLPYKSFRLSAKSLDSNRLGKQRAECKQLLIAIYFQELKKNVFLAEEVMGPENLYQLQHEEYGWTNHTATRMWQDYPFGLITYGLEICREWRDRGNRDETYRKIEAFGLFNDAIHLEQSWLEVHAPYMLPEWLGDSRLHSSHRSNLLRKDKIWYSAFNWKEPDHLPYFWPGKDYFKDEKYFGETK